MRKRIIADKGRTTSDKGGKRKKIILAVPPCQQKTNLAHKHTCNSVAFFSFFPPPALQNALLPSIHKLILIPNLSIPLLSSSLSLTLRGDRRKERGTSIDRHPLAHSMPLMLTTGWLALLGWTCILTSIKKKEIRVKPRGADLPLYFWRLSIDRQSLLVVCLQLHNNDERMSTFTTIERHEGSVFVMLKIYLQASSGGVYSCAS